MNLNDLDFMTQEEVDEILSIEHDFGVDISLDDILNDDDDSDLG